MSPSERDAFLAAALEVLAPRHGSLILTTPNGSKRPGHTINPHHAHEFTPAELRTLVRDTGSSMCGSRASICSLPGIVWSTSRRRCRSGRGSAGMPAPAGTVPSGAGRSSVWRGCHETRSCPACRQGQGHRRVRATSADAAAMPVGDGDGGSAVGARGRRGRAPVRRPGVGCGYRHGASTRRCRRDPRAVSAVSAAIRRFSPDVVHTHLIHADLWGQLAARRQVSPGSGVCTT